MNLCACVKRRGKKSRESFKEKQIEYVWASQNVPNANVFNYQCDNKWERDNQLKMILIPFLALSCSFFTVPSLPYRTSHALYAAPFSLCVCVYVYVDVQPYTHQQIFL